MQNKAELYAALVWVLGGLSLLLYCALGFISVSVPGVEELVDFLSSIDRKYIYLAAFLSILIEGLYFIGSFIPGTSMVMILALLSELSGMSVFVWTIISIFIGWCLAGALNIGFATLYRSKIVKLQVDNTYEVKDRLWTTWFPAFRANYEVAQVVDGGNPLKVFISSLRVRFWASLGAALHVLVLSLFINVEETSNEEGFVTALIVAMVSLIVGIVKMHAYFKSKRALFT